MYVCVCGGQNSEKHEKVRISDKVFGRIRFSHTFCVSHLSHVRMSNEMKEILE